MGERKALPDDVWRSLRVAFAAEVEARLPDLRSSQDLDVVRHHAHTLASSAWVVGEKELSELARAVETDVDDAGSPILAALVAALEGWTL